ncbi:MAG TPA: hypothetical protein EYG85_07785 [Crocinitomix sp.]|nr:hypothetical protein [Crocinitomix sp.]
MKNPHQIKKILIKLFFYTLGAYIGFKYAQYIVSGEINTDTKLELIGGANVLMLLMIIEISIAGLIHLFVKKE